MSLTVDDISRLAWSKGDGLLPAIVQDSATGAVLMLAYMNAEALAETLKRGRVVFYSRSRKALWEKGETSGNTLQLLDVAADCDDDALLVQARPAGPTCHRNTVSCFGDGTPPASEGIGFLRQLETVIAARISDSPAGSYTAKLYASGIKRMAQKVGEEGVETALAAQSGNNAELVSEAADLLFHLTLLLRARGQSLDAVGAELAARHRGTQQPPG
jgi:phosphoribosyl-ATP pyrophosphohydrolase/phosphoribosyl-AMP cyclohydrolase